MKQLGSLTSFADAERASDKFETLLQNMGITLVNGGTLERLHLVLKELADWHSGRTAPPASGTDLRSRFRELVGVTHLIDLALTMPDEAVRRFHSHFELLNKGAPLQNTAAPANDPSSDKVFELLIGMAAAKTGADVELDDPHRSKGDNPDVLVKFDGEKWGLACKVISGDAPATLFERIQDGVNQIETSLATKGLVVLNFKNRFDHQSVFPVVGQDRDGDPILGTYRDHGFIVQSLRRYAEQRLVDMATHATATEINELFSGKKALPGVLIVSQTTVGLRLPSEIAPHGLAGVPVVTRIGFLHLISLESSPLYGPTRFDDPALAFLERLNKALHV